MRSTTIIRLLTSATLALTLSLPAFAAHINLNDWGFSIDGTTYCQDGPCDNDGVAPGALPGAINTSGFDFASGLGTLSITFNAVGAHSFLAFFDHDIDRGDNTFFNEQGFAINGAAAGQSWEIDEPQIFPNPPFGDIFSNFLGNALDNSIFAPSGLTTEDVSMAMGWDFSLLADQTATIDLVLGTTLPTSTDLILHQFDPDSNNSVYFTSSLTISTPPPTGVPEPTTLLLMGLGLVTLAMRRRRV